MKGTEAACPDLGREAIADELSHRLPPGVLGLEASQTRPSVPMAKAV
jgi:hypothetical protein